MASAVDSRLAYAKLSAVATATSERLAALEAVAKHAAHEDMINFRDYVTDVDVEELERPAQGYEGSQKHSDLCKNR